jgi:protein SCO1/2
VKVRELFGDRVGKDIFFLSITIDPEIDTPSILKEYRSYGDEDWSGWLHLTGDFDDIESLRWILGVYDLDPVLDADKTEHAGIVTFGNDNTNWWAASPALIDPILVADTMIRIVGNPKLQPR